MALTKAIGKQEGANRPNPYDFSKVGPDGERGAYQMTPGFISTNAPIYLKDQKFDPKNLTPAQQDELAYRVVEARGKAGLSPAEIASEWNSGNRGAYKQNHAGTSPGGAHYDTPAYVNNVSKYYQEYLSQNQPQGGTSQNDNNTNPFSGYSDLIPGLSSDLSKRFVSAANSGSSFIKGFSDKNLGEVASGALQTAGAGAGAIGDVASRAMNLIPGAPSAENLLGKGIGTLANTPAGQQVTGAVQNYMQAHPTTTANAGAVLNIASLLPIGKAFSAATSLLRDAGTAAFKGRTISAAENELKSGLTTQSAKAGLINAGNRGLDPLKVLTSNQQFLPDVIKSNGKAVFEPTKALEAIGSSISADEAQLQTMLNQAIKSKANIGVNLKQSWGQTLKDIKAKYPLSGMHNTAVSAVNDFFKSVVDSSGGRGWISLNELNGIKRDARNAVFNISGDIKGSIAAKIRFNMGQSLMKQVEQTAAKAGIEGVGAINKVMSAKLEAQNILESIAGKAVKTKTHSLIREGVRDALGVGGELLGQALGAPVAGALGGRGLVSFLRNRVPKTAVGALVKARPLRENLLKSGVQAGKAAAFRGTAQTLGQ